MYKCIPPARPQHIYAESVNTEHLVFVTLRFAGDYTWFRLSHRPDRNGKRTLIFFHFVKSQVLLHWTCERVFSAAAARRHQLSYFKNALTLSSMSLYIGKNFAVRIEHERRDTQPRKPSSNAKCAGVLDGLPLPPPSLYAILYFTSIAYNFAI